MGLRLCLKNAHNKCKSLIFSYTQTRSHIQAQQLLQYLVDEADGWGLAAIQEVNINDLQLLQSDVEGLEFTVVPVQWDHLEQTIIQPQANHTAFWVYNSDNTRL